jgi:protein TonB
LASIADLDQRPRPTYRVGPRMTAKLRKRTPGKVYVIFIVDEQGRVVNPKVERSSDPIFNQPAINAVKRWRFEPGKRGGRSVRFRMRVPITFPKSR